MRCACRPTNAIDEGRRGGQRLRRHGEAVSRGWDDRESPPGIGKVSAGASSVEEAAPSSAASAPEAEAMLVPKERPLSAARTATKQRCVLEVGVQEEGKSRTREEKARQEGGRRTAPREESAEHAPVSASDATESFADGIGDGTPEKPPRRRGTDSDLTERSDWMSGRSCGRASRPSSPGTC